MVVSERSIRAPITRVGANAKFTCRGCRHDGHPISSLFLRNLLIGLITLIEPLRQVLNGCECESTSNSEWNTTQLMVEVAKSSANSYSPNTCRSYNSPSLISLSLSIELNLHALSTGSSTVQAFSQLVFVTAVRLQHLTALHLHIRTQFQSNPLGSSSKWAAAQIAAMLYACPSRDCVAPNCRRSLKYCTVSQLVRTHNASFFLCQLMTLNVLLKKYCTTKSQQNLTV